VELRSAIGSPPQTTMRGQLKGMTEIGILERRRQNRFPGSVDYELGVPGGELLGVAGALQSWLAAGPAEPVALGDTSAKGPIKALLDGWSSTMVRALAAMPLTLTELNRLISGLNYPSLERRLGAMRRGGLVEARGARPSGTPYAPTGWLRQGIAPLAAAAFWERRRMPSQAAAIGRIDVEAAFLLTVPGLDLRSDLAGTCRLAVELSSDEVESHLAGVSVEVKEGRIGSCVARLRGHADAWASGSAAAWLGAVIDGSTDRLEIGGDCRLAMDLIEGLHGGLFGARQPA
jgi:DNA-binding HxlR family transcriptional regulator